jgi:ribosomal protein L12E/L44/L45/RPP1/RPP2
MSFLPTILYRSPGKHLLSGKTTFDSVGIDTEDEYAKHIAQGWHTSLIKAIVAHDEPAPVAAPPAPPAPPAAPAVVPDDNAPPTRAEMVEQAQKLGITVDRRWSDRTLMAQINAAMSKA